MIFRRTARFAKAFCALPREIQEKALKVFALFQQDPCHPSLVVKKLKGSRDIWEGRIDQSYRFTFHYEKNEAGRVTCVFRNTDNHDECLKHP